MDFVKALTFIPEDPRWKEKVAIGAALALLSFLIVPAIITIGYCVRMVQNMRSGQQFPLPEWDDWSGDLVRGFKLAVVYLVWALPLIMVGVPMAVGGVMADSDGSVQMLGVTIMVGASCLMMVYGIFITSVSYTHLDVYKRQLLHHPAWMGKLALVGGAVDPRKAERSCQRRCRRPAASNAQNDDLWTLHALPRRVPDRCVCRRL